MPEQTKPQEPPQDRGGSQPKYSPNDDRSNVKNPTHPSHAADQENRADQARSQDSD